MEQDHTGPTNLLLQISEKIEQIPLLSLGFVLAAILIAILVHWAIFFCLKRATRKHEGELLSRVIRKTGPVARIVMIIAAIEIVFPLVTLPESFEVIADRIIMLLFIGTCGWLASQLVHSLTEARLSRYDMDAEDNLEARKVTTRMKVLRQGLSMIILLVTIAAMMMTFPSVRSIGVSLFASAGVAGIVIGIAARPVLSNLLAGIQIGLTQPMRIGDAVIMEGEWGWIEEITATYVVVKIWDWRRLIVPLTQIVEKPFQNWTRETSNIIGSVIWYLDYTAPVAEMRKKLKEFLEATDLWDGKVQVLQVIDTTEETVQIRALMSARNSPAAWDLRCLIREKMITWLQSKHTGALPRRRGQLQMDQTDVPKPARTQKQGDDSDAHMSDKIDYPKRQEASDPRA